MHQHTSSTQHFWRNCQAGTPAEVILGSPKTPHCKNLGICRIQLEHTLAFPSCRNKIAAYLRVDEPTGRLLIHFLKSSVSAECADYFFSGGVFRVEDDYVLSAEVASALLVGEPIGDCRLLKGIYPVLSDDHFLTISVKLFDSARLSSVMLAA